MWASPRAPPLESTNATSFLLPCMRLMTISFISVYRSLRSKVLIFMYANLQNKATIYRKLLRSEEHTSELQSRQYLVCRLLLEKIQSPLLLIIYLLFIL